MTGPPTPPPTSAIEIEDAARASLPPVQPPPAQPEGEETPPVAPPTTEPAPQDSLPQPSPQPVQQKTSYELLFPSVAELARSGNITELIAFAERADLSVSYFTGVLPLRSVAISNNIVPRRNMTRIRREYS